MLFLSLQAIDRKISSVSAYGEDNGSGKDEATAAAATEHPEVNYKNQILNQLSSKTGPCRVAWSEMPEVSFALYIQSEE